MCSFPRCVMSSRRSRVGDPARVLLTLKPPTPSRRNPMAPAECSHRHLGMVFEDHAVPVLADRNGGQTLCSMRPPHREPPALLPHTAEAQRWIGDGAGLRVLAAYRRSLCGVVNVERPFVAGSDASLTVASSGTVEGAPGVTNEVQWQLRRLPHQSLPYPMTARNNTN